MYKLGDRVMYGVHGVCEIVNIEQRRVDKKNIEYLVLSPVQSANSCFYIPTQNEKALSKLYPLLTKEELLQMLTEQVNGADRWVDDENSRKQLIKDVLGSGNRSEMVSWVRTMHIHRRLLLEAGKKFHQADEIFLKDAERLLTTEFAIVLGITESAVRQYVERLVV